MDDFKAITMDTDVNLEGQNKQLSLSVHIDRSKSLDLYIYSPYWIINKTGLPIQLRVNVMCFFHGFFFIFIKIENHNIYCAIFEIVNIA